jgi:hypothetical protein
MGKEKRVAPPFRACDLFVASSHFAAAICCLDPDSIDQTGIGRALGAHPLVRAPDL